MQAQKYALVTGGNRGIGLEVCRKLVQKGKPVIFTARSTEAAQQVAQQLRSSGVDAQGFALESGDASSIRQLVQSLQQYDQQIDLLVSIVWVDRYHSLSDWIRSFAAAAADTLLHCN
jgi:NAD(P)-dependent dehydrogenase (short-subunit alcohol dehydrogenase family)